MSASQDTTVADPSQRIQEALEAPAPSRSIEKWAQDVGEGWRPLVRGLDAILREIDPDYTILQVKEKFGGLRYYYSTETDKYEEMDAYIREAEELAAKTCEHCGAAGKSNNEKYWIQTLCRRCAKARANG